VDNTALFSLTQWMSVCVGTLIIIGFLWSGVRGIYRLVFGLDRMATAMESQQKELTAHKEDDLNFQKAMFRLFGSLDISKTLLIKVCARLKIDVDQVLKEEDNHVR